MIVGRCGKGTDIKGIFELINSASIDDPERVIAKSILENN